MRVYKWRRPRKPRVETPYRAKPQRDEEALVGFIHGERASAEEERLYKGLLQAGVPDGDIIFQPSYIEGKNLPGEKRPDFAINIGMLLIIYVDGGFWHITEEQKQKDLLDAAILMQRFEGRAIVERIAGEKLQTQEDANREASKLV